jgi:uncharacterized membrane-anchored protein YhcB (DUF1043 family)
LNAALWLATGFAVAIAAALGVVVGYLAARLRHGKAVAEAHTEGFNLGIDAMQAEAELDMPVQPIYQETRVTIH